MLIIGQSSPPARKKIFTTWDAAKKGSSVVLSGGNLSAAPLTGQSVGTILGLATGKWYHELNVDAQGSTAFHGMGNSTFDFTINGELGAGNLGTLAYDSIGRVWDTAGSVVGTYSTFTTGDKLMFAIDIPNNKWWVGKNGIWQNAGNPAAGTGAAVTSGISAATWYAGASTNAGVGGATLNAGASAFTYTVPAGFNAGLYS